MKIVSFLPDMPTQTGLGAGEEAAAARLGAAVQGGGPAAGLHEFAARLAVGGGVSRREGGRRKAERE